MNRFMLLSLLSLVVPAIADEPSLADIKEATAITYTVKIFHDKEYDQKLWEETVQSAANVIKKGQEGGSASEVVGAFLRSIEVLSREDNVKAANGIHGEMTMSISDDVPASTKCGDVCPCVSKYKGICPCTAENNCGSSAPTESIRTVCSEQCQKSGCDAAKCAQNGCVQACS